MFRSGLRLLNSKGYGSVGFNEMKRLTRVFGLRYDSVRRPGL